MANEEHLAILRQGVKVWNRWKNRNWKLQVDLTRANLEGLNLTKVNLSGADLRRIKLRAANLREADLRATDLSEADLSKADFRTADLNGAILRASDFTNAICWATLFANLDLAEVKGLDTVQHYGPSTLDIDTLYKSKGKIPEVFLRGCGVPENLITEVRLISWTAGKESKIKLWREINEREKTQDQWTGQV
jgi:hypothetical protein